MKHPTKPFAVEIKRSRRSPMPSPPSHSDFLGRGRAEPDEGLSPAFFSKDVAFSKPEFVAKPSPDPDKEFAIPAFLRSDKPGHRTAAESLSKEAEQVFAPKSAQPPGDSHTSKDRAPRILPSLISPESLNLDADSIRVEDAERQAPTNVARQTRKRNNTATSVAQTPSRTGRIKNGATTKPAAAAVAAQDNQINRKPKAAARSDAAQKNPAPAVIASDAAPFEPVAPLPDVSSRGLLVRRGTRRGGRDEIASLPPGQHWKRRLNPRAW